LNNWHEYFINMLGSVKMKSKDRSTQVGSIIVGPHHNILSTGFNGFPRGVKETHEDVQGSYIRSSMRETLEKEIDKRHERPDKYLWTEHAERNAIYNAARHGIALEGSTIYISWLPCSRCARAIIQSGIKTIVVDAKDRAEKEEYWNNRWGDDIDVSKTMLTESKINIIYYGDI